MQWSFNDGRRVWSHVTDASGQTKINAERQKPNSHKLLSVRPNSYRQPTGHQTTAGPPDRLIQPHYYHQLRHVGAGLHLQQHRLDITRNWCDLTGRYRSFYVLIAVEMQMLNSGGDRTGDYPGASSERVEEQIHRNHRWNGWDPHELIQNNLPPNQQPAAVILIPKCNEISQQIFKQSAFSTSWSSPF